MKGDSMDDFDLGRYGLGAAILALAAVLYIASCGSANAAQHEIRFQNKDATRAYTALRTTWGTVPVSCAPGATCSVVVDIPTGRHEIVAQAAAGSAWSADSNVLEALVFPPPAECLSIPACRFDADRNGVVSGSDFGGFIKAFNSTWIP